MIYRIENPDVKAHMGLFILVAGSVPKVGIELGYNALFAPKTGFAGLSQKGCTASKLTRMSSDLKGLRAGIWGISSEKQVSRLVLRSHPRNNLN